MTQKPNTTSPFSKVTTLETWETRLDDEQMETLSKAQLEGLISLAHEGKWGRYEVEQSARKSMMDKTPEVQDLLKQWPQTYGLMKDWPEDLKP